MTAQRGTPPPRPCPSCPYRQDTPSGVWTHDQYELLRTYDRPTPEQPPNAFGCHQADGQLCAGWLATHRPDQLFAVRIGLCDGTVDPAVLDYTSPVPVFDSGAAAADHGQRDVDHPGPAAQRMIDKIVRVRAARGMPVTHARRTP